jgi:hypothetical protein
MPSSAHLRCRRLARGCLFQFPNPTFYENRTRLVELVAQYRLPAMYNAREFVVVGGLIGYGASPLVLNRRSVFFIGKILKGAKPVDLAVERPTAFDFAINRTTAKMLGIKHSTNTSRRRGGYRPGLLDFRVGPKRKTGDVRCSVAVKGIADMR